MGDGPVSTVSAKHNGPVFGVSILPPLRDNLRPKTEANANANAKADADIGGTNEFRIGSASGDCSVRVSDAAFGQMQQQEEGEVLEYRGHKDYVRGVRSWVASVNLSIRFDIWCLCICCVFAPMRNGAFGDVWLCALVHFWMRQFICLVVILPGNVYCVFRLLFDIALPIGDLHPIANFELPRSIAELVVGPDCARVGTVALHVAPQTQTPKSTIQFKCKCKMQNSTVNTKVCPRCHTIDKSIDFCSRPMVFRDKRTKAMFKHCPHP